MPIHDLLTTTHLGADGVLWLLFLLSVASIGIMIDRALFLSRRRAVDADVLSRVVLAGDLAGARRAVEGRRGMEADVVRAAVEHAPKGAEAVAEIVGARIERSRLDYERRLAFFGTLGNNAPFVGLFGTVLGIIRAFADLATRPTAAGGAVAVMAGISDALVATAVGLLLALPAVAAFNLFNRALRRTTQRASILGSAVVAWLKAVPARAPAEGRP